MNFYCILQTLHQWVFEDKILDDLRIVIEKLVSDLYIADLDKIHKPCGHWYNFHRLCIQKSHNKTQCQFYCQNYIHFSLWYCNHPTIMWDRKTLTIGYINLKNSLTIPDCQEFMDWIYTFGKRMNIILPLHHNNHLHVIIRDDECYKLKLLIS